MRLLAARRIKIFQHAGILDIVLVQEQEQGREGRQGPRGDLPRCCWGRQCQGRAFGGGSVLQGCFPVHEAECQHAVRGAVVWTSWNRKNSAG